MQPTVLLSARGGTSADSLRGKVAPVGPTEWEKVAQRLAEEIKTRHYSSKTLKAWLMSEICALSAIHPSTSPSTALRVRSGRTGMAMVCANSGHEPKAYALWATKFRSFTGDKTPASVSAAEVKAYLVHLAVKCKVSVIPLS